MIKKYVRSIIQSTAFNYAVEFLITLALWSVWFVSAYSVLKDAIHHSLHRYVNANFWILACVIGVFLSILLGFSAYRRRHKIETSVDSKNAFINEDAAVCEFFNLDENSIRIAKGEKRLNVDFHLSNMQCRLQFKDSKKLELVRPIVLPIGQKQPGLVESKILASI